MPDLTHTENPKVIVETEYKYGVIRSTFKLGYSGCALLYNGEITWKDNKSFGRFIISLGPTNSEYQTHYKEVAKFFVRTHASKRVAFYKNLPNSVLGDMRDEPMILSEFM